MAVEPEVTNNRIRMKQLVKDATEAGFNPLTVMKAGGWAGYISTSSPGVDPAAYGGGSMDFTINMPGSLGSFADVGQGVFDDAPYGGKVYNGETGERAW